MDFAEGEILYVNKPLNWTSFDVVNKIRWQISRILKIKKVKRSGRADNQCAAFKPRTPLDINIAPVPRVALTQGQTIRIQYFKKHNQGQEATESYQLLQP